MASWLVFHSGNHSVEILSVEIVHEIFGIYLIYFGLIFGYNLYVYGIYLTFHFWPIYR